MKSLSFNLDNGVSLGTFIEIEAISYGNYEEGDNYDQCIEYMTKLGITDEMLLNKSYIDMMSETGN